MDWNPSWIVSWAGPWSGGGVPATPPSPTEGPVLPGFGFVFTSAIIATELTIAVADLTAGAAIPGSVSYDSGTLTATWTAAPGSPLFPGEQYYITVSGATAPDGTPMVPDSFSFSLN